MTDAVIHHRRGLRTASGARGSLRRVWETGNGDDAERVVDAVLDPLENRGWKSYAGVMTLEEHARMTASLALLDGASDDAVLAALLHQLGPLLDDGRDGRSIWQNALSGPDRPEARAARHLARWLPPSVTGPIALHLDALRALCALEPRYDASLPSEIDRELQRRGGALSASARRRFLAEPWAGEALQLRRWSDRALSAPGPAPDLEAFRPFLLAVLIG
jgi:gamma-butyrobetaine dioxygenase